MDKMRIIPIYSFLICSIPFLTLFFCYSILLKRNSIVFEDFMVVCGDSYIISVFLSNIWLVSREFLTFFGYGIHIRYSFFIQVSL